MMEAERIKAVINEALPLRPPRWSAEDSPTASEKISQLETYLMESAFAQAELEEALRWINAYIEQFRQKIEDLTGWEACLPPKSRERITQADINAAKRTTAPELFELGAEMKQLQATALRQIDRFRFEAGSGPISRAYTMITGG